MLDTAQRPAEFDKELCSLIPRLRSYATSLLRGNGNSVSPDDLVNTVIMKVLDKHQSFEIGSNMFAWLCTILRNEFFTVYRKQQRLLFVDDYAPYDMPDNSAEKEREFKYEYKHVKAKMRLLPPQQRLVLELVAEGFNYLEIAQKLNLTEGTVKSSISRARDALEDNSKLELNSNKKESPAPDEEKTDVLKQVKALLQQGKSVKEIAKELSIKSSEAMRLVADASRRGS